MIIGSSDVEDGYEGTRALWAKVIARAIYDWVSYRDSDDPTLRHRAEEACTWLFVPTENFNGLENICRILGVTTESIRARAKVMTKKDVAKIEHLDRAGSSDDAPRRRVD